MPGTELGKAYVQIVPKATGIQSSIEKELGGPGAEAGKSSGIKIGTAIKSAIIAAGIGTAIKAAVSEGAKMEQSFGGLDTIYGAAADEAKRYAAEAAKAGISANDYAEQAVSFGASLKQAFSGDTTKAVEAANTAILDMTDNAAKMGTPIESIQNAYAGFAKQNYTMLDNLKLGYGGTKTEMERLLKDAKKLSGVEYNIDNLGDVYNAIHVIQGEFGLTGVAAAEARTTLSGSLGAMKAALSNTLGNLALGEDIGPSLSVLGETVMSFLTNNLIPMVKNLLMALPELATALAEQAPTILMALSQSLIDAIPVLIPAVVDAVFTIAEKLTDPETVSMLLGAVIQVAGAVFEGLIAALPDLMSGLSVIGGNLLTILGNVLEPVIEFVKGVWGEMTGWFDEKIIQPIAGFFTDLWNGIVTAFDTIIGPWLEIARRAFAIFDEKIVQPISNAFNDLWYGVVSVATGAWETVKKVFTPVVEWFRNVFSKAWEAVRNVFSAGGKIFDGIKDGIANVFKNVVNRIIDGINYVVAVPFNAINSTLNTLRGVNILGVKPFGWIGTISVPQIPKLAKGGIVDEPTLLEAGEGDSAEAIIPLDKLWREMRMMWADTLSNGGNNAALGNVTINVYAAEGQSAEDIADVIMYRIQEATERRAAALT